MILSYHDSVSPTFAEKQGNSAIEMAAGAGNISFMKLFFALVVWIVMGVVLGTGILLAVKGSPWLLIAAFVGFVIAVGKIGCMAH